MEKDPRFKNVTVRRRAAQSPSGRNNLFNELKYKTLTNQEVNKYANPSPDFSSLSQGQLIFIWVGKDRWKFAEVTKEAEKGKKPMVRTFSSTDEEILPRYFRVLNREFASLRAPKVTTTVPLVLSSSSNSNVRQHRFAEKSFLPEIFSQNKVFSLGDAKKMSIPCSDDKQLFVSQLIIVPAKNGRWQFAKVLTVDEKNRSKIRCFDSSVIDLPERFRILNPYYQFLFQPGVPTELFNDSMLNLKNIFTKQPSSNFQGLVVPSTSKVGFIGDLHGDYFSLRHYIRQLFQKGFFNSDLKVNDGYYIVLTGDYGDRGAWGAEIYYILAQLKIKNPDKVFLVRGNHEHKQWKDYDSKRSGGLYHEVVKKYGEKSWNVIESFFDHIPCMVLFLLKTPGTGYYSYVTFVHGGISFDFNLNPYLRSIIQKNSLSTVSTFRLDSQHADAIYWRDFVGDKPSYIEAFKNMQIAQTTPIKKGHIKDEKTGRIALNMSAFREYITKRGQSLDWKNGPQFEAAFLIRGHEHNVAQGYGAARLLDTSAQSWKPLVNGRSYTDKTVYTFISCPGVMNFISNYTYGILYAAPNGRWYLTPYIQKVKR